MLNHLLRKWSESESRSIVSDYLQSHGLYSPRNSPGQNTGAGSFSLLQGIFPTQVSCLASRFFTSWATRVVQEYWSEYLSLLQWIFPTQEWNRGSCIVDRFLISCKILCFTPICGTLKWRLLFIIITFSNKVY